MLYSGVIKLESLKLDEAMNKLSCRGFKAAGIHAGLKKNDQKDFGLIYAEQAVAAAAVFTRNKVKAAPVLLSMERIQKGSCRAIVVNSGNANCCTGDRGLQDAAAVTRAVAHELAVPEAEILTASTGVIGAPLPVDKLKNAIPRLSQGLNAEGFDDFARAILTTDTHPKTVQVEDRIQGRPYHVIGIAKGAGMIAPDMATMLCFVCTDAHVPHQTLKALLTASVDRSLNRIVIDGDTSTNDVTFIMASGLSDAKVEDASSLRMFQNSLDRVLKRLAKMLVKDGEGVTKCVDIVIRGASSEPQALAIANTIATSPLVKTALFGEDANWGRLIAAAGRAQVPFDPEKVDIFFDDVRMVKNGLGCGAQAESLATQVLKKPEFVIMMDLHGGTESASVLTCDLSIDYIKINADYRS
jgi:glutamate N-acetyltransferase/amino-acid N-acetyltransferase